MLFLQYPRKSNVLNPSVWILYYLLRSTSAPYDLQEYTTDDYRHTFPSLHSVVEGNYLEQHKETAGDHLY